MKKLDSNVGAWLQRHPTGRRNQAEGALLGVLALLTVTVGLSLAMAVTPGSALGGRLPLDGDDVGQGAGAEPLVPMSVLSLAEHLEKAIVVDVGANRLYELRREGESLRVKHDYYVAIGKQGADKRYEGDEKTPVGVYTIQSHIPGSRLPAIYGVGALPMDYPSPWDRYLERTGSGIWIHGTNKSDDELLPRSSRGCLTLRNSDFEQLNMDVALGETPVVVALAVDWQPLSVVAKSRRELLDQVEQWRLDWESLDTDAYLSHYHSDFRSGGMNLARWKSHKSRVNKNKTFVEVELSGVSAYRYPGEEDLYVVRFMQDYRSSNYRGRLSKQQYWKRTADDGWKIIVEDS